MGFLDSLKAWLKTETSEFSDAKRDLEGRIDSGLNKRERQLNETPEEAMERLQQEIADGESSFHDIEDKIGHTQAKADAVADLADNTADGTTDVAAGEVEDILDLDSEEIDPGDVDPQDLDAENQSENQSENRE